MSDTPTVRNPKQEGTPFWDCIPQTGPCPMQCNQCFYNRPGAYYVPIDKPHVPTPEEVGDGIVRMNCGHDCNNQPREGDRDRQDSTSGSSSTPRCRATTSLARSS